MLAEHTSVMVAEVLQWLRCKPGDLVVDGTLGLAGHSLEIVKRIAPGGILIGLDWDEQMLSMAQERLGNVSGVKTHLFHTDYRALSEKVSQVSPSRGADGILLDLGLNNAQIEDSSRGISFRTDGPLDMRMDRSVGEPASAWLNRATAASIERVLKDLGDERWAKRIAQVIVDTRKETPLKTTFDLVNCIDRAVPKAMRDKHLHFATRTFQAIRVHQNSELDGLEECLTEAAQALAPEGTCVVLSYHSGEDRAAKRAFRALAETGEFEDLTRKPLVPTDDEVRMNPKSRSAKFRAIRRKS